jgi:oligopeptide/dipeptide ABC transporter ATP-binding protein
MEETVLTVEGVKVAFPRPEGGDFHAVDGVSLQLARGETLGIVGESGSGKTMLALSLMGLVPKPGVVTAGRIDLLGRDVAGLPEKQLRHYRGRDIGMIFQDPMTSLNPVRRVGTLLVEAVRRHGPVSREAARQRALEAFREVGIPSPEQRLDAYPHELSGGLRQRVMIALALVNHPPVIVADEPTTALDTTIQAQILSLMRDRLSDAALILITHDLGVAAEICNRIAVMYHGRIVETGPIADILARPAHPYTAGLLAAVPRFDFDRPDLEPIPGAPPGPEVRLSGCAFGPRCGHQSGPCAETPELEEWGQRGVACFNPLTAGGAGG